MRGNFGAHGWWTRVVFAATALLLSAHAGPASATPGDVYVWLEPYPVSAAIRVHGPWGATFTSTRVVQGPNDDGQWAYCAQAPVGGGITGGVETDTVTLTDYNAQAIRDNAARISAILNASLLPPPQEMQRVQFRPTGVVVLDFYDNEVDQADWQNLLWNRSYPGYDALPFEAVHRIEVAAVQAAIWHYTDGFDPTGPSGFSKQGILVGFPPDSSAVTTADVYARYLELVALGDATPSPTVTLDITASLGSNFAIFHVQATGLDQVELDASPALLYEYDPASGQCNPGPVVTTVDVSSGEAFVCSPVTSDTTISISATGSTEIPWIVYLEAGSSQDSMTLGTLTLDADATASIDVPFVNTEIMGCLHCPVKIKQRSGDDDFFAFAGELDVPESFDPSANPFQVVLSNANGTIYSGTLLAGDLTRRGRKYDWRDRTAKRGPGLRDDLYKVQLKFMNYGVWKFKVIAYPDLSAATLADMSIAITVNGQTYTYSGTFDARKNGWQLRRFPLP